ncbi:MAG: apolipoprotein N-acyltransferase [Methylobacterium sp.]|nr:apolipoprotein N-acyltransferase [Methylobacterium sp.]MCA3605449.1 apolipoprotein N-acyltransferase [Methylobacterium sp.]MCA3608126.1 apolipoprotein N-acyltransferase [Methylobacterium sp.]MCA3616850.1 apolipoprotein N-acyltransferase [Methylobacterium sp.]MCA3621561.1 apolipoprotein N-acyltransferase [Methylobacterium sp.]
MGWADFWQEWRTHRFALPYLAGHIALLEGRTRALAAFLSGLLAALALPPVSALPALAIAFPLLVWLLDGANEGGFRRMMRAAFLIGWCFGFGYFLGGFWWLGAAFIIGGEQFVWLLPLGVIGLPAGLAFFPAFGVMIARMIWSAGPFRFASLAFGLGASEWARAQWFSGFPWNGFGQVFSDHLWLAQGAALIGAEGLGLFALVVFATPAALGTGRSFAGRVLPVGLAVLALAALAAHGALRLAPTGGVRPDLATLPIVPDVKIRIVQPNIAQEDKNRGGSGPEILRRYLELSDRATGAHARGLADVTHLFWPEAAFPFILDREPRAIEAIARALATGGTILVTGAIRAEEAPETARRFRFYNSIQMLDRDGLQATYDKVHLVPFGEYLPVENLLRGMGLEQFVRVLGGFSAGERRRPLDIPGLPGSLPMICFETIFPHELAPAEGSRPVMVNVTNDAWFGPTSGPYQHFAKARLRTIEFGLPMIRAANSGISAVIDPYGRIVAQGPLGETEVIDAPLPAPGEQTLYLQTIWYSYATVMSLLGAAGSLGFGLQRWNRRRISRADGRQPLERVLKTWGEEAGEF